MEEAKRYWNEKYWVRHMKDDDLENIEDPWIDKYVDIIYDHKGQLLDLGCGRSLDKSACGQLFEQCHFGISLPVI